MAGRVPAIHDPAFDKNWREAGARLGTTISLYARRDAIMLHVAS